MQARYILLDICEVSATTTFASTAAREAAAAPDAPHTSTHAGRTPLTPPRLSSPRRRALSARRPRLPRPRRWRQTPTLAAVPAVTRRPAPKLAAASSTATRRRVLHSQSRRSRLLAAHASSPPTPLSSQRLAALLCTCRRASRHPAAAPALAAASLHKPPKPLRDAL